MRRFRVASAALAALALSAATPARAQETLEFVTAVPESPAFIFLGASPTRVTRPGATRDFAAALLTGVDDQGKAQNGFALEATAIDIIPGVNVSLPRYRRWENFVAANTQLSIGTARSAGDSASTDLALGVRVTLLDQGDPMLYDSFTVPVGAKLRECTNVNPDLPDDRVEATIQACSDSVMAAEYRDWTRKHWNARRVAVGGATGTRLVNSAFDETDGLGAQLWLVGANPVGSAGQAIGQLTYRHRTPVGDSAVQNLFSYGLRMIFGSPTFNGFGEVIGENPSGTDGERRTLWSGGVEFRVGTNLWLSTGLGARYNELSGETKSVVLANLRWGMTSESRFAELRPGGGP